MTSMKKSAWLLSAAIGLLGAPIAAHAQQGDEAIRTEPPSASEIVVPGEIIYRNRSDEAAPVLEYGLDYFQRFEPLTVGDMMKRVPSVAFVSDVLEFDGVQLRGLDPGYTQVLINGERTPGAGLDRSFFVDRIPAELVERVEIVRSSSANRSGDAVAGALNIVLKDAYSFEGAFARLGALHFNDGEFEPVFGAVYGGQIGAARVLLGANIQGRRNPKEKFSTRYSPDDGVLEFDNREDQTDLREGTDYSFNGSLTVPVGEGELEISGYYVLTDRSATEVSTEWDAPTGFADGDRAADVPGFTDVDEQNYALEAQLEQPWFGGEFEVELGYARFESDVTGQEAELTWDGDYPTQFAEYGNEAEQLDSTDEEWSLQLSQRYNAGENARFEFGVDYNDKSRDSTLTTFESELDEDDGPFPAGTALPPLELDDESVFTIEETRIDPYLMFSDERGSYQWEAGLRYEHTDVTINDGNGDIDNDYAFFLPSAHLRVSLTDNDRVFFSVARTVRRPNFDYLAPALLEEEPTEDNDLLGNPLLEPESAWGVDIGYEHRIGRSGIAGINFFYRDVTDVIELASTGVVSSSGDGFVFQPMNVGDGSVRGIELDFSAPLTVIGLENTGVFLNYSWLDSEITDPVTGGERRFNNQAESVFNVGFIHNIPAWAAAFGATYRQQGVAFSRVQGETVETTYGGDLEIFVEKRFGENFTLRFTGLNLLDLDKEETFYKWEMLEDQLSGDPDDLDEFEFETESSGPVFQLVGRLAF